MKITNQSTLTSKITFPDLTEKEITTLSTESNTEYMTQSFTKTLESVKTYGSPSDEIEQIITLTNDSDYPISDITITCDLGAGATYVEDSLTIDDTPQPDVNPADTFSLGKNLDKNGGSSVVKYKILVDTTPTVSAITNSAEVTYTVNERIDLTESTNEISISVTNNKLVVTKTSDKSAVISGDKLTYTISIKNEGNMDNKELFLKDPLPSSITFVDDSVKINDTATPGANPITGFNLPVLNANSEIKVTFEVMVN